MKVSELKPRKSSFKLSLTGKEYFMRSVTPNDHALIEKNIGSLKDTFETGKIFNLFKIAYILLEPESTFDFAKKQVTFIDMDGNQVTETTGGFALFASMLSSLDEQFDVIRAVLECMGLADEYIKELLAKRDEITSLEVGEVDKIINTESKKKAKEKKKKRK